MPKQAKPISSSPKLHSSNGVCRLERNHFQPKQTISQKLSQLQSDMIPGDELYFVEKQPRILGKSAMRRQTLSPGCSTIAQKQKEFNCAQKRDQMKQFGLQKKKENGIRNKLGLSSWITKNQNAKSLLLGQQSLRSFKQNNKKLQTLQKILDK